MTDIVERLRALEACEMELAHDGDCPPEATANWKHAETCREAASEIERLRAALRDVMVGGNHLATVLGIGHLAAGSSYEAALDFYGPGPNYDVWCCWNAIMEARAAPEDKS